MRCFVAALALGLAVGAAAAAEAPKTLKVAFPVAETGFDPAQINDIYSRTVTPHIFEGLYHYDHLARPAKIRPLTAAALPEISEDFRSYTIRLQPGIYFAADPAFKGAKRELVAEDYVFSFKRFADPKLKSPVWTGLEQQGISGLAALRREALDTKRPFDYDRPIEGLQALDRYTLRIRLDKPRPRFTETLATGDLFGAVAREVVEHYGDTIAAHPVGTGPFRLAQWRRSSLIVLERSPDFRELRYAAEPAPDDAEGQALLARLKGRRLPIVDRVEVSIINEQQPRWLAFLNAQIDLVNVPSEFIERATPGGKLAPNLAKQGVRSWRVLQPDSTFIYFNMEHPLVGGYSADKVALRRAIGLAIDVEREIRTVWKGQAVPAQSIVVPHTTGYDPAFKSEMGDFDPARAKALLDLYGYVDRDRDGWRDQPDGRPLVLEIATQPDQNSRQFDELWQRNMNRLGLRLKFAPAQWPENLKAGRAGKLMVWQLGSSAAAPDGQQSLWRLHGPQAGGQNFARFARPEFDAIFDRMSVLPDGPERAALFVEAKRLAAVYMPYKVRVHRILTDLAHPWVIGYRRPLFWQDQWQYIDVDDAGGR
ncbi:MAG TPA: ABC transporter substrate-binding protein [Methylibium sp.]|nr:ABC transporter substrate-binding protein [Methylibium sp.]